MDCINFSLLLPTRGRPERLKIFLDSVYHLSLFPQRIEIILFVDEDDSSMLEFKYPWLKVKKIVQMRNSMGFYNTVCFERSEGDIIIAVNDDIIIKTFAWDKKIVNFHLDQPDSIYLAYPNDLHKKEKIPTFPILSRKTCEILQAVFPVDYRGSFLDLHLFDIFMRLKKDGLNKIFFLKDILFEHFHFRNKKANLDETYSQRNRFADDAVFVSLVSFRQQEACRLKQAYLTSKYIKTRVSYIPIGLPTYKKNFFINLFIYFKFFMLDKFIPVGWKIFLFYYFTARLTFSLFFNK